MITGIKAQIVHGCTQILHTVRTDLNLVQKQRHGPFLFGVPAIGIVDKHIDESGPNCVIFPVTDVKAECALVLIIQTVDNRETISNSVLTLDILGFFIIDIPFFWVGSMGSYL